MGGKHIEHFILDGIEVKKCRDCGRALPVTLEYFGKRAAHWDGLMSRCHECEGYRFKISAQKEGYKICKECGRELEQSLQYFRKNKRVKDGFSTVCKECMGYKFKPILKDGYKVCNKCGQEFPATNEYFWKDKNANDGLNGKCKSCSLEYAHQYNEKNKEWLTEWLRQYRQKPREERRLYNYEYYKAHPLSQEKKKDLSARRKGYRKLYNQTHKEEMRIKCQRRRAKKKQLPSTLTKAQWLDIKEHFNHKCAYCGKEESLTQDHFIPVVNNGEYTHNNIIPACASCNFSKGDRDFFLWYPKQEFYSKVREKQILKFLGYSGEIQQLALM